MYSEMGRKYKRRVNQKTNYVKRYSLLKSRLPRLVLRVSNMYINLQYVDHNSTGDNSKLSILSKELSNYGWNKGFKSTSAAYLSGYLFAKLVQKEKLGSNMIFDIGLHKAHRGGVLFAALKGAIDGGLNIPAGDEAFPSNDRLEGKHNNTADLSKKVKGAIDKGF